MDNGTESPLVAAQRSAILQLRGRYERGELPFDAFRDALDALTKARAPEECRAILANLPHSPLATLAALEPPTVAANAPKPIAQRPAQHRITAFMSETRKTRGPWTLAPETHVRAVMGSVRLDLRRAQIPSYAYLKVSATMSEVTLFIPDDVAVTVRSTARMSEVNALGESVAGVIASGYEEHIPTHVEPRAQLVIDVSALMGSVNIALMNASAAAIADLARDMLRSALEGMRRGWENGGQGTTLPSPNTQSPMPRASIE
ncbi:MAG TPA: LiaF domain-containing protein [Ktedonobacterales bacterium]